ncbi:MAG TPA: Mu transposase C-terminal domain-containing protein [Phycisphaerae bacterium]|nr:Mu transposase C-terminal domain-containing protein [Phycisphaerae bacterium]
MQALASKQSNPTAPPKAWLAVQEAARILGKSTRAIRWQCQTGALAAERFWTSNGPAWFIDPDCRPAFRVARGEIATPALADDALAGLTAGRRTRLYRKYQICQAYLAALANRPAGMHVNRFLGAWVDAFNASHRQAKPLAARTLQRWLARLRRDGIAGLLDPRGGYAPAAWSPEAKELFIGMYLDQARPRIPALYERMAAMAVGEGWEIPCLRTVQKFIAEVLDPKLKALGRDPKAYRDRCLPHVERDWSKVPAMGCWIADHRQHDVWLPRHMWNERRRRYEWRWYRPWLTAFLDGRSWMPVAWSISFDAPDGNRTMGTFVRGVIDHGQPEELYLDNGKDFRMHRLAGGRKRPPKPGETIVAEKHVKPLLEMLGVGSTFALPYNAKAKIIEPWFGLLAERFDKTWETYCGRRADLRPERLKGYHGKAQDFHAGGLTIEAFQTAFNAWATADYALRKSPSKAAGELSAARAFAELRRADFVPQRPAVETLMLLLMPSVPVRVDANGIYVRAFGQHYWSDALEDRRCGSGRDLRRKVVYRYDGDDPSAIYVFDAGSDKFLCAATPYIGGAIDPLARPDSDEAERLAQAIALQRSLARRDGKKVSYYRQVAGNALLATARQAAATLGRLDDPATIPAPAPPTIQITAAGELDRAAVAAAEQRRRPRLTRPVRAADLLAATGTEDEPIQQGPGSRRALDLLADPIEESNHVHEQHPPDTT